MWLAAIWEQALKRGNARQPPADLCDLSIQKVTYPMLDRASGFFVYGMKKKAERFISIMP